MDSDPTIIHWLRKTRALSEQLMVDPSDVYSTLIDRGYTEERPKATISVDQAVAMVSSVFRPEETLATHEVLRRFRSHKDAKSVTTAPSTYVRLILSRHSGSKGKRRFRRVVRGGYRLELSNAELRVAILSELRDQRQFVGSRRIMEMFEVPYDRLADILTPLVNKGEVISKLNASTQNRSWCLPQYSNIAR